MAKTKVLVLAFILLAIISAVIAGCTQKIGSTVADNKVTIYKSMSCGCCQIYTDYMENQKFEVTVVTFGLDNPAEEKYNIPANMQSCHTTVIGNYFVEGHVPAEAIAKLMSEKPDIAGIALPGMPSGSPGMPGAKKGSFVIYAIDKNGGSREFMRI